MMRLKPFQKNSVPKPVFVPVFAGLLLLLLSGCTSMVSAPEIERDCQTQTDNFISRVNCMVDRYNSLPEKQRSNYEDLDRLFLDQAVLLADQVTAGKITAQEAEVELSKTRSSIETQRRARNSYYDRGRFGMGVGIGHGHPGYWGSYGW
ncbi:MAG: hypothetical protein ACQEQL_00725 [Pseudomonadota bacterium]